MKVLFLDAARADLREGVRYYEAVQPGLGRQFGDEIAAAVTRIRQMPVAWPDIGEGLRRHLAHPFPYGIIYKVRDDTILIVSIAHLHREPGHWRDRLSGNL